MSQVKGWPEVPLLPSLRLDHRGHRVFRSFVSKGSGLPERHGIGGQHGPKPLLGGQHPWGLDGYQ